MQADFLNKEGPKSELDLESLRFHSSCNCRDRHSSLWVCGAFPLSAMGSQGSRTQPLQALSDGRIRLADDTLAKLYKSRSVACCSHQWTTLPIVDRLPNAHQAEQVDKTRSWTRNSRLVSSTHAHVQQSFLPFLGMSQLHIIG